MAYTNKKNKISDSIYTNSVSESLQPVIPTNPNEFKESVIETKNTVSSTPANSSYQVKVTTNALNIRRGPGENYSIMGCITDYGIYTIVETTNNWGRLKSGLGWICLDYTKRV